jgi:hypothetical protein
MAQDNPGNAFGLTTDERPASGMTTPVKWWDEASIWTDRMVSALGNGVKGGKSRLPSQVSGCSR